MSNKNKKECISCDGYGHPCTCEECPPLKIGDVLYEQWGYDQTNINFYVILNRTKCTVTISPIKSVVVENVSWAHDKVVPNMKHAKGMVECGRNLRMKGYTNKRIKFEGTNDVQIKLSSYSFGYLYDGTPKTRTSYA